MRYIKFTEDRTTVEAVPQIFVVGRVYELPEASCERWKKRNAAVDATETEFKAQTAADKKASGKAAAKSQPSAQTPPNTTPAAEAGMAAGPVGDDSSTGSEVAAVGESTTGQASLVDTLPAA